MTGLIRPAETLATPGGLLMTPGLPTFSSRDLLVAGTYVPGPFTTGVPATVQLEYKGTFQTQRDNQVIMNVRFTGWVNVKHSGVIFINCWFDGGVPTAGDPSFNAVKCYKPMSPSAKFYDCTFAASEESVAATSAIQGQDFEMYRCNISGFVDGIKPQNGNVKVWQSWIHDLIWYPVDPAQTDGSHNDGLQCEGNGGSYDFSYNNIEMGYHTNACIIVTQNLGVVTGLTIYKNWLRSVAPLDTTPIKELCGTAINLTQKGKGPMSGVSITWNQFSPLETWKANADDTHPDGNPTARAAMYIDAPTFNSATISNNFYEGTQTPVKIIKNPV